jgi:GNAT superfamily N-acetyltransferase
MVDIRPYRAGDLDKLYDICLKTGDDGADATHLYRDPNVIGHVYAGAYGVLSPETVFMAEDGEGIGGYIIGPVDTYAFEKRCEVEWWPALRVRYAAPSGDRKNWSWDERMAHHIHHPQHMPRRITELYSAHLHINLLPRMQKQGIGKQLIDRWRTEVLSQGASGAHLAVGTRNARAVAFYSAYGFRQIERFGEVIVFAV